MGAKSEVLNSQLDHQVLFITDIQVNLHSLGAVKITIK
jgi:hypothetical protein